MGNHLFEFSKGRFVQMNAGHSELATRNPDEKFSLPWLDKLTARLGAQQITLTRDRMMRPLAAFGVVALLVIANIYLLTGPAEQRLANGAFAYGGAAEASVAAIKSGGGGRGQERGQPGLWAAQLPAGGQAAPRPTEPPGLGI